MGFLARAALSAAWVLVCCNFILVNAVNIDTSFDVQGSCTAGQKAILNTMVAETLDLIDTARPGVTDWLNGNEGIMSEHLTTFFMIPNREPSSIQAAGRVGTVLDAVHNFLNTASTRKPKLYCDSHWLQQKQPGDLLQDSSGNTLPSDNRGQKTIRREFFNQLRRANTYAYWSPDDHFYMTASGTEGSNYCDQPSNLAITVDKVNPKTLTMCPQAFVLKPGNGISDKTATLGVNRPTEGQSLQDLQSISLTFLHEVIHVARSVAQTTVDGAGEEYYGISKVLDVGKKNQVAAVKNPDSYVFFTLSYWYWYKKLYDSNIRYKFVDGKAIGNTV